MRRIWIPLALLGIATLAAADPPVPLVKTVEIHAGMPSQEVRIVPTSTDEEAGFPHTIGRVEIYRPGEPKPFQTIEVQGDGSTNNLLLSCFQDVNFDGYTDLLLGNTGGAKWGGYAIYFYDPKSGTFRQTRLSREMSERLRGNNLEFDYAAGEIQVAHLIFGCPENVPVSETYVIERGHLRQTGREDLVRGKDEEGCYRVIRKVLADGSSQEVARERAPEYDGAE